MLQSTIRVPGLSSIPAYSGHPGFDPESNLMQEDMPVRSRVTTLATPATPAPTPSGKAPDWASLIAMLIGGGIGLAKGKPLLGLAAGTAFAQGIQQSQEATRTATLAREEADLLRRRAGVAEKRAITEAEKADELARHNQEMERLREQGEKSKAQASKEQKSIEEFNKMRLEGEKRGVGYIVDPESIMGDPQAAIPRIGEAIPQKRSSMAPTVRAEIEEREARTAEHRRKAEAPEKSPKPPAASEILNQIKILKDEWDEIVKEESENRPKDEHGMEIGEQKYTPEQKDRIQEIKAKIKILRQEAGGPSLAKEKEEPRTEMPKKKKITGEEFDELKKIVANFREVNMRDAAIRVKLITLGVEEHVLKMLGL